MDEVVRRRRVPRGTVVILGLSVVLVLGAIDWGWGSLPGSWVLLVIPLGLVGAVWALCSRSIEIGDRAGWAIISASSGFVLWFLIWHLGTLLFGP